MGKDSSNPKDSGLKSLNSMLALANLRKGHEIELKMFQNSLDRSAKKQAIFIISNEALNKMLLHVRGRNMQKGDLYSAYNELVTHWFLRPLITTAFDTEDLLTHFQNWGKGSTTNIPVATPATYIPRNPDTNPLMWITNACSSFMFADIRKSKGAIVQFYAHNENVRRRVMQIQDKVTDSLGSMVGNKVEFRQPSGEFCVLTNFSGVMIIFIGPELNEIPIIKQEADDYASTTSDSASDDVALYLTLQNRISEAIQDVTNPN